MTETFLILLAGGVMLAAAVSHPRHVTVHWLRLAGILALAFAGIAVFFVMRREMPVEGTVLYRRIQAGMLVATIVLILAQLAFVQMLFLRTQRVVAALAFVLAVMVGAGLLHALFPRIGIAKPQAVTLQTVACAGVAAMTGLALMDMLLGHAYLTAAKMTIAPFRRLNLALAGVLVTRVLVAVGLVLALHSLRPVVPMLWGRYGLYMLTRWVVGLAV